MSDTQREHPGKEGLPGDVAQNGEEHEPVEPTKRKPTEHERGGGDSTGSSSEGSQSTGNPNSAG
jgi:hypothetical protein